MIKRDHSVSIRDDELIVRIALFGASAYLFATGFKLYPSASSSVVGLVASLTAYLIAFVLVASALTASFTLRKATLITTTAIALGLVATVAFGILFEIPTYGTDVISFAHAGGEALLNGVNPYSTTISDVGPTLERLGYSDALTTPTTGDVPLTKITYYPGGHVLGYTAFLAVGLNDLRWATLVFEIAAVGLVWFFVSPLTRLLLPLVLLVEPLLAATFTAGGNTDWLWVLPLVACAVTLSRGELSWAGLWLGIACAVKQQPWFAVPFVAVWVYKEYRSLNVKGNMVTFLAMLGLGFLLPNIPFILWNPSDWLAGVLGPVLLDVVPAGQGISQLIDRGWIDLPKSALIVILGVVAISTALLYLAFFDRIKHLLWVLPPFVLFFSYRSLHSYFVYWLPLVILWIDLAVVRNSRRAAPGIEQLRLAE